MQQPKAEPQAMFVQVGMRPAPPAAPPRRHWWQGAPLGALALGAAIVLCCAFCTPFLPHDPTYMDLAQASRAPCRAFWFGTDAMGRDIFSMVWYGGRASLCIGFGSAALSTMVAILVGAASGLAPRWLDALLMRAAELLLCVPELLLVVLGQAALGAPSVWSLALVTGLTGWAGMAKVVRAEVRQLRCAEYVLAARCLGAGFWRVLLRHLTPNFVSSIMFMAVMNIRSAIAAEATLSFMGIGLPLETVSWGSMLSLAQRALVSGGWWMILIPGAFLVATLLCVTAVGNWLRGQGGQSNL